MAQLTREDRAPMEQEKATALPLSERAKKIAIAVLPRATTALLLLGAWFMAGRSFMMARWRFDPALSAHWSILGSQWHGRPRPIPPELALHLALWAASLCLAAALVIRLDAQTFLSPILWIFHRLHRSGPDRQPASPDQTAATPGAASPVPPPPTPTSPSAAQPQAAAQQAAEAASSKPAAIAAASTANPTLAPAAVAPNVPGSPAAMAPPELPAAASSYSLFQADPEPAAAAAAAPIGGSPAAGAIETIPTISPWPVPDPLRDDRRRYGQVADWAEGRGYTPIHQPMLDGGRAPLLLLGDTRLLVVWLTSVPGAWRVTDEAGSAALPPWEDVESPEAWGPSPTEVLLAIDDKLIERHGARLGQAGIETVPLLILAEAIIENSDEAIAAWTDLGIRVARMDNGSPILPHVDQVLDELRPDENKPIDEDLAQAIDL